MVAERSFKKKMQFCSQILIFMSLALSDIEDDDAICTALSCLRAVNTVLHSVHSVPTFNEGKHGR